METTTEELGKTSPIKNDLNKDSLELDTSPKKLKYKCQFENCDVAYRKKWLLEEHIRKHNKERPFVCTSPDCNKTFTKDSHLKRHKVMVHEKSCEQICDFEDCGKIFNNKYSLKKHKTKVHNKNYSFICSECSKGFLKRCHLTQHMFVHTGEPPFKCHTCNLGFLLSRDLAKHNRNHKTYTCECGEIFDRWSKLRAHKKDICRLIEKKCRNCSTLFSDKKNLHAHYKICSSKFRKTFQCPYLNCTKVYQYNRNLKDHIKSNHGSERPKSYVCNIDNCERAFSHQCLLNRHIKKHGAKKTASKRKEEKATRKDKGTRKTYLPATLAGVKLSRREHLQVLKGNKKILSDISKVGSEKENLEAYTVSTDTKVEEHHNEVCTVSRMIDDHDYGIPLVPNERLEVSENKLNVICRDKLKAGNLITYNGDETDTYMEEDICSVKINTPLIERDHDYGIQLLSDAILLGECARVLNKLQEYIS
ncbi:zinc finger protein 93 [Diabrotica virgifera virgifera]|uniref:C2H2-type domain-containing protein n=1 Tax=Diabrotica virgifera virgifera TaxID=50390 RepID=A0ABM5ID20_DIAVI|nr:zinc finger protein 93 [Diabrotica virgifera virgifera]XP_028130170.2 zinc finger protein 93 [Diabrotica virgifera virgifera]